MTSLTARLLRYLTAVRRHLRARDGDPAGLALALRVAAYTLEREAAALEAQQPKEESNG